MLKTWLPVLVVDDSFAMASVMKGIILTLGFEDVQVRENAAEAMDELTRRDYGLVLCDINMSPVGGAELVRMMRSDKYLRGVPVILTTGNAALVAEMYGDGTPFPADGFILKPFTPDDLKTKLAEVLEASYQKKDLMPQYLARLNRFDKN